MIVPFFRTLILYFCIIAALRLMGKRQLGEMQPNELVVTILISAVASVPMQDIDIPITHGIVPVITLAAAELLFSAISLKSKKFRKLVNGSPIVLIRNGEPDREAMKKLRVTVDDLLEDLRLKDVFDIREVRLGQMETNGRLSVLLRKQDRPVTPGDLGIKDEDGLPFSAPVTDGAVDERELETAGKDREWLEKTIKNCGAESPAQVFLLLVDQKGGTILLRKDG